MSHIRRAMIVVVAALLLAGTTVGAALADPPPANDSFAGAGSRVFDLNAVGRDCTIFADCDDVSFFQLNRSAVTRYFSTGRGDPATAFCKVNDLAKVHVFPSDRGEVYGWTSVGGLHLAGNRTLDSCTLPSRAFKTLTNLL